MKKLLALILVALLVCSLAACGSEDDLIEQGNKENLADDEYLYEDFIYSVNEAGDYEIVGYIYGGTELQDVVIPEEIEGRPVTGIAKDAFKACKNIGSVTLTSNITYIGEYAFYDCDYITEIVIPDSVTVLSEGVFRDCDKLATVTLPDGLKEIGNYAFQYCEELNGVTLPRGLTAIGAGAFNGCVALTEITVPETVEVLGDASFFGCTELKKVTVEGNGLKEIGEVVFDGIAKDAEFTAAEDSAFYAYALENSYIKEALPPSTTPEDPNGPDAPDGPEDPDEGSGSLSNNGAETASNYGPISKF